MKILFIGGKCVNIYRQRMIINLRYLMYEKHEIYFIQPSKNMYKKIQEIDPKILFMSDSGREHGEILLLYKGKDVVTVSDVHKDVDVYIEDEPEVVLPLLAEAIEQGKDFSEVPGITYRHKTKPAKKWNVNSVKPIMENHNFLTFSTRGCKGRCSFCIEGKLYGSLRYRNIPDVIDEIKSFSQLPGFKNDFCFADPSFDSNTPERMKKILKAIIKEIPCHTYDANFRPDFHKMADKELMELLLRSGLAKAFIGVESVNAADLELYNKGTTKEDAQNTIDLLKSTDCYVDIGFINLNPISTFESLRENVAFLRKNHLGSYQMITKKLDLHDGTPIKNKLLNDGLLWGSSYYDFRDKKVKALASVLVSIDNKLNKKAVELYSNMTLREVKRQKKLAAASGDNEAFAIVMKYEPTIENLINNESNAICSWFSNLIDMVDQCLPINEIMNMSGRFMNDEYLKIVIKHFKSLEKMMMDELAKLYDSRE
jgi:anaerobic magnesium-protoporphyrin IX monomethyl ester cyclase